MNLFKIEEKNNAYYNYIVFACYLPPEWSPWADPTTFFGHLISQIYVFGNVNTVFICGDLNVRIGRGSDCALFDDIPKQKAIDNVKNTHGENLIDFLKEIKFCSYYTTLGQL